MAVDRRARWHIVWRIVFLLLLIWAGLTGCNLTDPGIPFDHTTFRTLTLPACTIEEVEVAGNWAKLRIIITREETTSVNRLQLCYSRQNMLPDLTCGVQDITPLFSGQKDTVEVTIEGLSYSSDYACRVYMSNQKNSAYSSVTHIITQASASILCWEKVGEFPTSKDIYKTAFSIGQRAFVLSGQSHSFYQDTPENPVLWEYRLPSQTWEKITTAPFEARIYVSYFVIDQQVYIGCMHNGEWDTTDWWCYDLVFNEWTRKKDFIVPVTYVMAAFSVGNKGYLIASSASNHTGPQLYAYDPVTDSWEVKGSFPGVDLQAVTSFVHGDFAYILGGYMSVYKERPISGNLWAYNSINNQWRKKDVFTGGGRAEMISIATSENVFAGFGMQNSTYGIDVAYDWWRYLPETDKWEACPTYIYWPSLYFTASVAFELNGDIYIGSGTSGLWKYSEK